MALLEHARAPKQTRSKQSFDRVIDAATQILAERGFTGLTLTQVIGSHASVDWFDLLPRRQQGGFSPGGAGASSKEMDHGAVLVNRVRRKSLPLRALSAHDGSRTRALFAPSRRVVAAFMQQATHDSVVETVGKEIFSAERA